MPRRFALRNDTRFRYVPLRRAETSDQSRVPNGVVPPLACRNELAPGPARYAERKLATSRVTPNGVIRLLAHQNELAARTAGRKEEDTMYIPESVLTLMNRLEKAGYQAWAVGGCVRDASLGITPHDYDCCTDALPERICEIFSDYQLVLAGMKHGTVGVVTDSGPVEITTFRTEGDYTDARHPGWVRFVPTIEEDLSRRDFTVNAMAFSPIRGYADPFGGRRDLDAGILRAVGNPRLRFQEDALRILRGLRFAARFHLTIEPETFHAMEQEIAGLDALARERVFSELKQFLCKADTEALLRATPFLVRVIPELAATVGFDQRNPHHDHDVFTHIAHVVSGVPAEPVLRLAALLHDIGKPGCFSLGEDGRGHFHGHAQLGAEMADTALRRLKASTKEREEAVWLIDHHMDLYPVEEKAARRCLSRHGLQRMESLLALQRADLGGKGVHGSPERLESLAQFDTLLHEIHASEGAVSLKTLAVKGSDLLALGYTPGKALGQTLNALLQLVLSGDLPNDRDTLLAATGQGPEPMCSDGPEGK